MGEATKAIGKNLLTSMASSCISEDITLQSRSSRRSIRVINFLARLRRSLCQGSLQVAWLLTCGLTTSPSEPPSKRMYGLCQIPVYS